MWVTFTAVNGGKIVVDMAKVVHVNETASGCRLYFVSTTKDTRGTDVFKSLPVAENIGQVSKMLKAKSARAGLFFSKASPAPADYKSVPEGEPSQISRHPECGMQLISDLAFKSA